MLDESLDFSELTRKFLTAYEAKQLDVIAKMFSAEIVLKDWNYEVSGYEPALAEFAKNFADAKTLKISIKQLLVAHNSVAAEIEVLVNNSDKINVVDVLRFNETGQILSIFAYKGS